MPIDLNSSSYVTSRTSENIIDEDLGYEYDESNDIEPDSSDIIGGPYSRSMPGRPSRNDIPKDMTYGTEYVARLLGMSTQAIRNYIRDYEEYLNIERKPSGHHIYTQESIDKLRDIIRIKDEHNFTTVQMKQYLSGSGSYEIKTEEEKVNDLLEKISDKVNAAVASVVSEALNGYIENNRLLIEEKDKLKDEAIESLKEQVVRQQEAIIELKDLISDNTKTGSEYKETIDALIRSEENKNREIQKLVSESEKKDELIKELEKKTKKRFFGIL